MKPSFTTRTRWMFVVVLLALVSLAMPVNHAGATTDPNLDQYQETLAQGMGQNLYPGSPASRFGQTFTAGRDGILSRVQLNGGFLCNDETGWTCAEAELVRPDLVVEIHHVGTDGLPTGDALSRTTFVPDFALNQTGQWIDVDLPGIMVAAGFQYAVVWSVEEPVNHNTYFDDEHNSYYFELINPGESYPDEYPIPRYPGGTAMEEHASQWYISVEQHLAEYGLTMDWAFRTYVAPFPTYAKEEPIGSAAAGAGAQTFRAWRNGKLDILVYQAGLLNGTVPSCGNHWLCGYDAEIEVTYDFVRVVAPDFNPATGTPIAGTGAANVVKANGTPVWQSVTWRDSNNTGGPILTAGHVYALVVREVKLYHPPDRPWASGAGSLVWSMAPRTYVAGNAWRPDGRPDQLRNFVFRTRID